MKKKFVSLLLAAALVFSLGVPAFAEGAEALPAGIRWFRSRSISSMAA